MTTYHKNQPNFPSHLRPQPGTLSYTKHAVAMTQRYGYKIIPVLSELPSDFIVFELTLECGSVTKYGIRFSFNKYQDLCMVIAPIDGGYRVVTNWLNHKTAHCGTRKVQKPRRKKLRILTGGKKEIIS